LWADSGLVSGENSSIESIERADKKKTHLRCQSNGHNFALREILRGLREGRADLGWPSSGAGANNAENFL
jgi:hypothetical protein